MSGITKEQFDVFEEVRSSGVTNMYATNVVSDMSGLSRDTIYTIMKYYPYISNFYYPNR